jgi:NTP pyrophosphatase (non-canonical NTP hydrolase)
VAITNDYISSFPMGDRFVFAPMRMYSDFIYGETMKPIDTQKIDQQVSKFIADRDWDQFHSIKNLSMALSVESSELVELFQWMKEEDSNLVSKDEKLKARVSEELADIFVYMFRIAKKSNIDLEQAVLAKIQKNSEKYPIEKARGSAKKYNEY